MERARQRCRRCPDRSVQRDGLIRTGHTGDARPVGENVWEFRFTSGPGYRVCYTMRGQALVLLLAGGDKAAQDRDIAKATALSDEEET